MGQRDQEFAGLAEPLRAEILGHCYRMLGSAADAEDAVQETYLRAWRAYDRFEGRSSFRVWLHQIAANACLRAVEQRGRRAMPSGLGAPDGAWDDQPLVVAPEVRWIQPLPVDPADVVGLREHVRLAFVAALQHLPARQRAVLILRDVAGLRAEEVADALGTTTIAVNSSLRRARAQLARRAPAPDDLGEPDDPRRLALLDRYVAAFRHADIGLLTAVLREDVTLEMPPHATWFAGRGAVAGFLGAHVLGRFRAAPLPAGRPSANGQPTFVFSSDVDRDDQAHALHVLDVTTTGVAGIHVFLQPELFAPFGLTASR
ncbi:RNA polymerase subunit sigma-70 [Actinoplanes sp. M2I2]|uniref:RNA polymerase subunit sigma-70 n=1 Tax=Actinoplanes sp. M2I2 TaxID=1734444 RepID=UPI00201FDF8B|nr:RNA polymerase subunit sigma-70 [Actinoplanes sp. M2I2]